jgi:hypothetical protein
MYVCMYVCVYVCMCVCMHVWVWAWVPPPCDISDVGFPYFLGYPGSGAVRKCVPYEITPITKNAKGNHLSYNPVRSAPRPLRVWLLSKSACGSGAFRVVLHYEITPINTKMPKEITSARTAPLRSASVCPTSVCFRNPNPCAVSEFPSFRVSGVSLLSIRANRYSPVANVLRTEL